MAEGERRELTAHPLVRTGAYVWSVLGLLTAAVALGLAVAEVRIVVVPLVLALFPAALLTPLTNLLRRRGVPAAVAALTVLLGGLGLLGGAGWLLSIPVAEELPQLTDALLEGAAELESLLADSPLPIAEGQTTSLVELGEQAVVDGLRNSAGAIATAVAEGVAQLVLGLLVLFFYLKDGARIARWLTGLFPERAQHGARVMGTHAWEALSSYFRGQLFVAFVDAVFIGIGLLVLGVPLAVPLAVLVFFGGLFPIVGAVASGAVAVLVALADGGVVLALLVLALVIAVQQFEGNILQPFVLAKATQLHPLAVILALTAGGVLLGVLGAFLAVPVAASVVRGVGHLRAQAAGAEPAAS